MKTTITKIKSIALVAIAITGFSFSNNAQTSVAVTASGLTFTPNSVTINVGDTVIWTNTSGFHNVNATLATYPSNPEGFGNALAAATWTFMHVFTIPGTYDYQCDAHVSNGMVGQVIVNGTANLETIELGHQSIIYPIPAEGDVNIEINQPSLDLLSVKIVDANGKMVYSAENLTSNKLVIDTKNWAGIYFYQLIKNAAIIEQKKLIITK